MFKKGFFLFLGCWVASRCIYWGIIWGTEIQYRQDVWSNKHAWQIIIFQYAFLIFLCYFLIRLSIRFVRASTKQVVRRVEEEERVGPQHITGDDI